MGLVERVAAQSGSSSDGESAADPLRGGGAEPIGWGATPAVCLLHSSTELCVISPGRRPVSWLCHLCRKVAEQVDINDLPEDLGKIATTLLEDKTGTQVGGRSVTGCS